MARVEKVFQQVLRGDADANVPFQGMRRLLQQLGFEERVRGSHHIFTKQGVPEILTCNQKDQSASRTKSSRSAMLYSFIVWLEGSMPKYEVIIYWSAEDQAFIAEVPELPGCASDGKTYQQALASLEVIIREWIETAKEQGRSIPAPKGRLVFA